MKITYFLAMLCITIAMYSPAARSQSTTHPTTAESFGTLPELKFDNVKLDDVLAFLADVDSKFAPQLVRDPGVPADYPMITFRAKNITIPQFLEFLQKAYGIESTKIPGPVGPVYLITVAYNDRVVRSLDSGAQARSGSGVHVYSISDVVQRFLSLKPAGGSDAERTKQALNDVLTLVQAGLEQTPQGNRAVLKVHEGTQTLLFKGTAEQEQLISNVLATLREYNSNDVYQSNRMLRQLSQQQEAELKDAAQQAARDASRIRALEAEIAVIHTPDRPTTRP
jgi:hypothetical protein